MRTVSRYLLVEFLTASTAVFLAMLVTWVAADTLLHLDSLAGDASRGMRDVLVRTLDVIGLGVPLACLAGVVWSLTRAVRSREITAIRCGGIPLRSALVPLLLASTGIAAGIAILEDRVFIPTRQALSAAALEAADGGRAQPVRLLDRWWYTDGSSVFSARSYDPKTGKLSGVSVFRFDERRNISERIDARSATHVEASTWEFRSATVREFGDEGKLTRRRVGSMRVDIGLTGGDLARAAPPPGATTLHKLARAIRDHRGDLAQLAALQTTFHGRLAQPLAALILVLLAIPFGLGDDERGSSLPRALLLSMACAGGYWLLWTAGLLTGLSGLVSPFVPIWGVTLLALGVGLYRYRQIAE